MDIEIAFLPLAPAATHAENPIGGGAMSAANRSFSTSSFLEKKSGWYVKSNNDVKKYIQVVMFL